MRLWSIHPSYLDQKALVALWREGLLARAVLRGATRGYKNHPQLVRFKQHEAPLSAINNYLGQVELEARARGYKFDRTKLGPVRNRTPMSVSTSQLAFELTHLVRKVEERAPSELVRIPNRNNAKPHPLFRVRKGPIESWERGAS